jgi:subtilase family serine protease
MTPIQHQGPQARQSGTVLVFRSGRFALAASLAALLVACGGGGSSALDQVATGAVTMVVDIAALPSAIGSTVAEPFFHAVPAVLPAPPDAAGTLDGQPLQVNLSAAAATLGTSKVTLAAIQNETPSVAQAATNTAGEEPIFRAAAITSPSVYTPALIRAAYGLPATPAAGAALSAAQAAQMGAGQTIYIVDAYHNPNAALELAAFNQKFALPPCASKTIATNSTLPIAAASSTSCEFVVVYSTSAGSMTSAAPSYNVTWAQEIALDVQWAHAIAPLARIVLIEAPDASMNGLLGGIRLANAMGPGIVSMSFGTSEGSWTSSSDSVFTAPNMTYLAATGDWAVGVYWPSVSSNVLAVGGTTLSYSGSGTRSEVSWAKTGGGVSAYVASPSYQNSAVPGMGSNGKRIVADVAFNADPASGQYTAVIPAGKTAASWLSMGGTSISTPQWAGLIAIANAQRALASKPALGLPHNALYGQIATVPGSYASSFADITQGSHGTCGTCTAKVGFDQLTGLGTPNVASLLEKLTGTNASAAPSIANAAVSGTVGTALTFTVSTNASNPVTYSLSGSPAGMVINSAGVVNWASPAAGTYSVVVSAKDNLTGLSGQGTYTVTISNPQAPVVKGASVTGKPNVALSFTATATAANPVTYTLTGAPKGMVVNTAGVVSWPMPIAGTYSVTVTAKDTKTGLNGSGVFSVMIASPAPVVANVTFTGTAGKALSGSIAITDPTATKLTVTVSGQPNGMTFALSGTNISISWPKPVKGSYSLKLVVTNNSGASVQATVPIIIN